MTIRRGAAAKITPGGAQAYVCDSRYVRMFRQCKCVNGAKNANGEQLSGQPGSNSSSIFVSLYLSWWSITMDSTSLDIIQTATAHRIAEWQPVRHCGNRHAAAAPSENRCTGPFCMQVEDLSSSVADRIRFCMDLSSSVLKRCHIMAVAA